MIVAALAAAGLVVLMLRRQWQSVAQGSQRGEARILAEHVVEKVSTHTADGTFRYVSSVYAGLLGEYPGSLAGRHRASSRIRTTTPRSTDSGSA